MSVFPPMISSDSDACCSPVFPHAADPASDFVTVLLGIPSSRTSDRLLQRLMPGGPRYAPPPNFGATGVCWEMSTPLTKAAVPSAVNPEVVGSSDVVMGSEEGDTEGP